MRKLFKVQRSKFKACRATLNVELETLNRHLPSAPWR
jgi:hypothetical protein